MMRLCRQHLAGYFDLRGRYAQLLQKCGQGVKTLRLAQLNRPDSIFVTTEADRKHRRSWLDDTTISTDDVDNARRIAEGTHLPRLAKGFRFLHPEAVTGHVSIGPLRLRDFMLHLGGEDRHTAHDAALPGTLACEHLGVNREE